MDDSKIDLFYYRNAANSTNSDDEDENKNEQVKMETSVSIETICEDLNAKWKEISGKTSMVVNKSNAARGIWDQDKRMVRLDSNKYLKQYSPIKKGDHFWLNPYEALLSIENRVLAVSFVGVDLSLEDAYNLLLENKRQFLFYRVFSVLSRSGYYVHQTEQIDSQPRAVQQSNQENRAKRKHEDSLSQECEDNKKLDDKTKQYPVVTNVRPLRIDHLRNLTKIDHKLIDNSECKQQNAFLYTIRESVQPVDVHRRLRPLYGGHVKPLLPLGSTMTINSLCELMQSAGPSESLPNDSTTEPLDVHLSVFPSMQAYREHPLNPLYHVTIVTNDESLPSIQQITWFHQHYPATSPLIFALLSDTLVFNFYSFDTIMLNNEFPVLWKRLAKK